LSKKKKFGKSKVGKQRKTFTRDQKQTKTQDHFSYYRGGENHPPIRVWSKKGSTTAGLTGAKGKNETRFRLGVRMWGRDKGSRRSREGKNLKVRRANH